MAVDLTLPWARTLDADRLAAFIDDLWGAAGGPDDLATLDAIEAVIAKYRPHDEVSNPLTARQQEVLALLVSGLSTAGVGHELGITQNTVNTHRVSAYRKLNVQSLAQAVAVAIRNDWLPEADICASPPPRARRRSPQVWAALHRQAVATMREQPGVSVDIGPYGSRSGAIRVARNLVLGVIDNSGPAGSFAAVAAVTDSGEQVVRARYLGAPADSDTARTPEEGARP